MRRPVDASQARRVTIAFPGGPRVLDLSTGLSGAYAALVLSYAGADVARAEPAGGDPLRRWRHGAVEAPGDGALFEYLRQGQTSVRSDGSFDPLGADILIVSPDPAQACELRAVVAANPGLIAIAFTAYGLDGPYSDRPASDLTVEADSGGLAIRGRSDAAPYQMGGRTCEWLAGAYGAAAALALWAGRRRGGPGGLIDLSQAELLHAAASNYMDVFHAVAHAEDGGADADPTGPPRTLETPSIERSADGWVGFNTNSPHQIAGFLNMIGRPDLVASGEYGTAAKRIGRIAEWQELVTAWTSQHPSAEILAAAEANGVPVAPVSDSQSVAGLEQVVARRTLIDAPRGRFQMPGQPWRINNERRAALGPAPVVRSEAEPLWRNTAEFPAIKGDSAPAHRPLEGLRVLDLTTWWAGPSATAFLAALGAEVIHVEAPARMDPARMVGAAFLPRPSFWELSNFFLTVNVNKRDLALDLTSDRGRELFLELVKQSDVVVENATPRVMDKLKLGWDVIHAANPKTILTRMPAYGLDGPWRERPGFAQNIEQASGLAWLTGQPDDQPRIQRGPADPNGGMHAAIATLVALEQRERTGEGSLVESSLFDAALAIAAELVIEWSAYQNPLLRQGNRSVTAAPQGVYACQGDDSWLALTVASDEQWRALTAVIDRAELTEDAGLATEAGRRSQHDFLDSVLTDWAAKRDVEDAVTALLAAGIPAAHARDPRLAARNPQFRERGYHQLVEHPIAGIVPIPTLPFQIDGGEPWIRTPSPTLGQHNAEILSSLLGLSQEDLDQLTADGVIATAPKF
jgi:crotonobetainyl-CoA:carnitine CoA-transferase CaiB-like acyl-CoA transferase